MQGWTIRNYKVSKAHSQESTAYTCEICLDGVAVLTSRNDGTGGPDWVDTKYTAAPKSCKSFEESLTHINPVRPGSLAEFNTAAWKWCEDNKIPTGDYFKPDEAWMYYQLMQQDNRMDIRVEEFVRYVRNGMKGSMTGRKWEKERKRA